MVNKPNESFSSALMVKFCGKIRGNCLNDDRTMRAKKNTYDILLVQTRRAKPLETIQPL